ncbi:MAG: hypothetical protein WKF57_17480 [Nakamurella sp.]
MTVAPSNVDRRPLRRALITLCVTETISWGILYYAFPVMAASISADTGWSTPAATAAFSAGLVVSAICGIPIGRLLQHRGPRLGRGLSSLLAAVALGLLGAGQLVGRILFGPLSRWASRSARTAGILTGSAVAVALLAIVLGPAGVLIALVVLVGAVRGATTLLQATVVADHWGIARYAALSGWFAAPITIATALAPWAGIAVGTAVGSFPLAFGIFAVLIAGAAVTVIAFGNGIGVHEIRVG